ncbi:MAG: MFS transporter [Kiritimatiellae bacterium]|nr:MFS transporter [Kiritimatiellia bacterium]MBQ3341164.1 MFS transporter [Kiritimatiellia bacterium]MBQ6328665.1 MFS transporter [Kiritimatiellia bacterium]
MKGGYKWFMLGLLSLAFFFSQADRVLFGLLTIPIQDELHLTDLQVGVVNTALFVTLAFTVPLAGILGDRFNRKWVITCALLFWSAMTAATGLVGGICGMIFFRSILTGGGEAFYGPSAYALIAAHHKETRSLALAIHQAALYLGLMFSGALVAWVLKAFGGWRVVFWVFGGSGFVLGLFFIWALKDRTSHGRDGARPSHGAFAAGCRAFFCRPTVVLNAIGFIAICFANNAYISWAPKFAAQKFGLSVGAAGNGTMLYHHLAAFMAILVAGWVTDVMIARGNPRFRLALQTTAMLLGAPMLVWFGFSPTVASCFAATTLYGVFRGIYEANTQASAFDAVRPENRSTVVALADLFAMLIGSLSPLLIGAMSDRMGMRGFEWGFALMGGVYVVGAVAMAAAFLFTFNRDRICE